MHALAAYSSSNTLGHISPSKRSNLKRKRFHNAPNHLHSVLNNDKLLDDNDDSDFNDDNGNNNNAKEVDIHNQHDSNSNSSSSSYESNVSSASSSSIGSCKLNKIKHGHKILITEEKMTDALRDLQLELNSMTDDAAMSEMKSQTNANANNRTFVGNNEDYDFEESEDNDMSPSSIRLSEELKSKLKEYNKSSLNLLSGLNPLNVNNEMNDNMQMVVWSPRVEITSTSSSLNEDESEDSDGQSSPRTSSSFHSSSSNSSDSTLKSRNHFSNFDEISTKPAYLVEEPHEMHLINKLKRKYSQLNKINIEEVKFRPECNANENNKASFYLVDQECDGQNLIYLNPNSNNASPGERIKISEIEGDSRFENGEENDEQKMEF